MLGYRASDTIASPTNPAVAIDDPKVGPYDTVEADPYYTAVLNVGGSAGEPSWCSRV